MHVAQWLWLEDVDKPGGVNIRDEQTLQDLSRLVSHLIPGLRADSSWSFCCWMDTTLCPMELPNGAVEPRFDGEGEVKTKFEGIATAGLSPSAYQKLTRSL
jgi:hypothetical protein